MPFDPRGFFYGTDALEVADVTQQRFIDFLAGKLNDPTGPYRALLGKDVFVSQNTALTSAAYSSGTPSVTVWQGKGEAEDWGKAIGAVDYEGERRELSLNLDCAAGLEVHEEGEADALPVDETRADNRLQSFIESAVRAGYDELWELGLTEIEIRPDDEKQRAGEGRNPMLVTYAAYSLSNFNEV